jgi:hypothetical protein
MFGEFLQFYQPISRSKPNAQVPHAWVCWISEEQGAWPIRTNGAKRG